MGVVIVIGTYVKYPRGLTWKNATDIIIQQDNNSDFPDAELLTHLAPAQGPEQCTLIETGAESTASVGASNGHIPSDVHLMEEHQDPPNCKVYLGLRTVQVLTQTQVCIVLYTY